MNVKGRVLPKHLLLGNFRSPYSSRGRNLGFIADLLYVSTALVRRFAWRFSEHYTPTEDQVICKEIKGESNPKKEFPRMTGGLPRLKVKALRKQIFYRDQAWHIPERYRHRKNHPDHRRGFRGLGKSLVAKIERRNADKVNPYRVAMKRLQRSAQAFVRTF